MNLNQNIQAAQTLLNKLELQLKAHHDAKSKLKRKPAKSVEAQLKLHVLSAEQLRVLSLRIEQTRQTLQLLKQSRNYVIGAIVKNARGQRSCITEVRSSQGVMALPIIFAKPLDGGFSYPIHPLTYTLC